MRKWKALCPKRETDKKDSDGQPIMVLDFVFPNGLGHVESLQNIYKRYWDPIQPKAFKDESHPDHKPPHFGFHSLRHVAARMFIAYLNWTPNRDPGSHGTFPSVSATKISTRGRPILEE